MRLWLIKVTDAGWDEGGWGYDCHVGFVVRANSEEEARHFAEKYGGNAVILDWKNSKYTSCAEVSIDGEAGLILCSFNAG